MMATHQIMMKRHGADANNKADASVLKSILVHVQDDETVDERIETALSIARAASAHLSCIHVTSAQAYVAFDSFGGMFVMKQALEAIDEQAETLKTRLESKLSLEDVAWDYEEITSDVPSAIISRAALADLVVTAREPRQQDFVGPTVQLLGDLLYHCRSPLFIPGDDGSTFDPAGTAVIAWDGSLEAANAIRSSISLLKLASEVKVLQVVEEKEERFPGTKMLEYLSRHGIAAELTVQEASGGHSDQEAIAATLVSFARGARAAYLVMGGYGHRRFGEFVFRGVTRTLLKDCPVALVMAH